MSTPAKEMVGNPSLDRGDSYRDNSRDTMVDFPDPERPTIAVHECLGIVSDISRSAKTSGRDGYRKLKPVIVTGATRETPK